MSLQRNGSNADPRCKLDEKDTPQMSLGRVLFLNKPASR